MSIFDSNEYDVRVQPVVEAARAALKARLYVPGWMLNSYLSYIIHNPTGAEQRFKISLAYQGLNLIGVGYYDAQTNAVATFVKPAHRRKGVGTKLVEALNPPERWGCLHGIYGSDKFWNKWGKNMPPKEHRQRGLYYR